MAISTKKIALCAVLVLCGLASGRAETSLPSPPSQNPHPPQSAEDKRRVDFAVQEIRAQYGPQVEIFHAHIIPWAFKQFLSNQKRSASGTSSTTSPANDDGGMQINPTLKADEYIVHAYVKFPNDPRWHNLKVILSEDSSGKLTRRGFHSVPLADPSQLEDC